MKYFLRTATSLLLNTCLAASAHASSNIVTVTLDPPNETIETSIKNAIAEVRTLNQQGKAVVLYFPAGEYRYNNALVFNEDGTNWLPGNVYIKGDGVGKTIIRRMGYTSSKGMIRFESDSSNIRISDIEFQCEIGLARIDPDADTAAGEHVHRDDNFIRVISAEGATNLRVTDCSFATGWLSPPENAVTSYADDPHNTIVNTYPVSTVDYDSSTGITTFGPLSPYLTEGATQQEIDDWVLDIADNHVPSGTPTFIYHTFSGYNAYNESTTGGQDFFRHFFRKRPTLLAILAEDSKQVWIANNHFFGMECVLGNRNVDSVDHSAGPGIFYIHNYIQSPHNYAVTCLTKPKGSNNNESIHGVRLSNNYINGMGINDGAFYIGLDNDNGDYDNHTGDAICSYIHICNNTVANEWISFDIDNDPATTNKGAIGILGRSTRTSSAWIIAGNIIENQGDYDDQHLGIDLKIAPEGDGINQSTLDNLIIQENAISKLGNWCMRIYGENVIIAKNHIRECGRGINLSTRDAIICSNYIDGSYMGLSVNANGSTLPAIDTESRLLMTDNRADDIVDQGIRLHSANDYLINAQLFGNRWDGSSAAGTYGIQFMDDSTGTPDPFAMVVYDNTFNDFHAHYSHTSQYINTVGEDYEPTPPSNP